MQEKNQTISFLLIQIVILKKQMKEMEEKYEKEIIKMKNENDNLIEKLENSQNELKNIIKDYQNKWMEMNYNIY